MAKTAKPKKREPPSAKSRAGRRAPTPDLDAPKPTKAASRSPSPAPHPGSVKPHVLARQSGGITKNSPRSKPMKRAQRLRQQRGIERAEENLDKLMTKVQKSVGKEKVVKERAKGWEEVNGEKRKKKGKNAFEMLAGDEEEEGEKESRNWGQDEQMDGGEGAVVGETVPAAQSVPLAVQEDEQL